MSIRNLKLGGTDMGAEDAKSVDWNDTFDAVQYEQKVINSTSVTVSSTINTPSSSDTDTSSMSVSIPAGVVNKYIEVKVYILGKSEGYSGQNAGGTTSNSKVTIVSVYSAVDTTRLSQKTFTETYTQSWSFDSIDRGMDRNSQTFNIYYEPTTAEKTNGFDIRVDLDTAVSSGSGGGCTSNATITCEEILVMGI